MIVIIGYGSMAEAILKGLLQEQQEVMVVGRNREKLETMEKTYHVETALLDQFDITDKEIVLAIKPFALNEVATQLIGEARILYSILAGIPIKELHRIKAKHYVRAMPNIAAAKRASMTTLTGDEEIKDQALKLFNAIGESLWVESEKALDIATAIAGSGPAFLALVAEAIADGGVACGLKREDVYILMKGLFKSSAAILEEEHPAIIKDKVMSPAGTTAAGYAVLEERAVRSAFIEAIKKAYERAKNAK